MTNSAIDRSADPNATVMLMRALHFAAERHIGQRRKGDAQEPYVNHLSEVALLLAEATDGNDPVLIAGGLLHDTIEDTFDHLPDDARIDQARAEIATQFGDAVADLVVEVTDDKALPKAERKRLQIEKAPHKSRRARMVKIADKTSNLRALRDSPPSGWPLARQRDYLQWATAVVAGCRGVSPWLEARFDEARAACAATLENRLDAAE